MEIKAADVAKLRKMTGAGMMDCKKALEEANGDFERAQEIIREKGKLIASKRADREATEGLVVVKNLGKKAYILCLACETDFVAKNEGFKETASQILEAGVAVDASSVETLVSAKIGSETVADFVTTKSGQTGEKVEVSYFASIEAEYISSYVHFNGKLGTLIGFNKQIDETVAKNVAMQAATMAPICISREDCPKEVLDKEYKFGYEQAHQEGKPEAMLEKIAEGKPNKFLAENALLNQSCIDDNKISVEKYIKNADAAATVVAYKRVSLAD